MTFGTGIAVAGIAISVVAALIFVPPHVLGGFALFIGCMTVIGLILGVPLYCLAKD